MAYTSLKCLLKYFIHMHPDMEYFPVHFTVDRLEIPKHQHRSLNINMSSPR